MFVLGGLLCALLGALEDACGRACERVTKLIARQKDPDGKCNDR